MERAFLAVAVALFGISLANAQTDVLIEINTGRMEGIFTKSPVFQRAILSKPAAPTETAVLFFRGYPGIARIQSVADKQRNLLPFMRMNQQIFQEEGIALVIMDCPTDQWGARGPHPTNTNALSNVTNHDDLGYTTARPFVRERSHETAESESGRRRSQAARVVGAGRAGARGMDRDEGGGAAAAR